MFPFSLVSISPIFPRGSPVSCPQDAPMQVLSLLSMLKLSGVKPIKDVIDWLGSVFVFDLALFRVNCLMGNDPIRSYACQLCVWPMAIAFALLVLFVIHRYFPDQVPQKIRRTLTHSFSNLSMQGMGSKASGASAEWGPTQDNAETMAPQVSLVRY